ncbi:MAG: hypothetical protein HYV54_00010 [Parcubacteria group bacterium]|nr:hypothetical protein [Parcubacteria group bacterium]
MRTILSKQQFFSLAVSVLLSVFMVAVVAYGATITISNRGVGSGTSTPGAALGVSGAAIVEDFVWSSAFIATSTSQHSGIGTSSPGVDFAVEGNVIVDGFVWTSSLVATSTSMASGFGTTTPGADFSVVGNALFDGGLTASFFNATSTTATSTLRFGITFATTTAVDGNSGRMAMGTTSVPNAGVMGRTSNPDPALTISGVGNAAGATGTLYITGETGGGEIIMKSANGTRCVSIMANTNGLTMGGSGANSGVAALLSAQIVPCPK